MIGVDKVKTLTDAVHSWREHYSNYSRLLVEYRRRTPKSREDRKEIAKGVEEALDRRRVSLACMAATLLLHDRAIVERRRNLEKVKADFEREGMFMPGFRYQWVGDRPIAIPIDYPVIAKNPFSVVRVTGV